MIRLIPIDTENIASYQNFVDCYSDQLRNYMSRIRPHESQRYEAAIRSDLLRWYYISFKDRLIGSVWLEKEHASDTNAFLGIFICGDEHRSMGYGRQAIKKTIDLAAPEMKIDTVILHVRASNKRAVRCYETSGFHSIQKGIGPSGQPRYVMKKQL